MRLLISRSAVAATAAALVAVALLGAPLSEAAASGPVPSGGSPVSAAPMRPASAEQPAATPPPADWLAAVYADRPDTPLSRVVLPGTHDSGAFAIPVQPPCDIQVIAGTSDTVATALKGNPCVAAGLTRAQDRSLAQQLADGIRYLDIRVGVPADRVVSRSRARKPLSAAQAARVPLVLQHTLVSQRLTRALTEVIEFAVAHPREQVILDVQHVDLTGVRVIDGYYTRALDLVLRRFDAAGTTVCDRAWSRSAIPVPDASLGTDVTLRQAWAAGRNLLILTADGELPKRSCYRSRGAALWSPWPNTDDPAVSVADNESYLTERSQALAGQAPCRIDEGNRCGLFVSQLQLSVQLGTQFGCLVGTATQGCTLAALAGVSNPAVPGLLDRWRVGQARPVNIAIVDFYDPAYVASIIDLNQRIAAGG